MPRPVMYVCVCVADKHEVKLTVAQGATLSWEFTVKSHDVGFGVFFGEGKVRPPRHPLFFFSSRVGKGPRARVADRDLARVMWSLLRVM
jgi:hypothetical protein